jgi:hypothetical protein
MNCAPPRALPGCGASGVAYGSFTDGFDTAGLKEAKTLLDELA